MINSNDVYSFWQSATVILCVVVCSQVTLHLLKFLQARCQLLQASMHLASSKTEPTFQLAKKIN